MQDMAFDFATKGFYPGRCPLTGQFVSSREVDDDPQNDYFFGGSYDSTDDILATIDDAEDHNNEEIDFAANGIIEPVDQEEEDWYDYGNLNHVANWAEDTYRYRFPHLWGDDGGNIDDHCLNEDEVMPAHSSTPMCDRIKLLGYNARKWIRDAAKDCRGPRGYEVGHRRTKRRAEIRSARHKRTINDVTALPADDLKIAV